MVEAEPALPHLLGQLRQGLIHCGPVAKVAQSLGPAALERLAQAEPAFVVDILVEVDVDPHGGVVDEEPSCLRDGEAFGLRVDEDDANGQRGLGEAAHGIVRQLGALADLLARQPLGGVAQQVQDAPLQHQPCRLEHRGPPGDELGEPLRLAGRQLLLGVGV